MKALISLVIIVGVYLLGKSIFEEYQATNRQKNPPEAAVGGLEGLPAQFEPSLQVAQAGGAATLRDWLQKYGQHAQDPRLADIQLDYVVLLSRTDPNEAKQLFQAVKRRTPKTSPVYERIKKLDSTYGH